MSVCLPHWKDETVEIDGHIDGDGYLSLCVLIVEDLVGVFVASASVLLFPWMGGKMEQGIHGWIIVLIVIYSEVDRN